MLFEKFPDDFRITPIKEWPDTIKELTTKASIKDAKNVREYLSVLQHDYGGLPEGQRDSLLKKD